MSKHKTWLITGTSKGFGRIWAEAALERGDRVAGTARDLSTIAPLVDRYGDRFLPLQLDITDRRAVDNTVAAAERDLGELDIVVNNAGIGLFGMIEEVSESQVRAMIETNLLGALWVTKAVVQGMRERRSGHIIQVSSIGGVQAFPGVGIYHASKWALEGFSQSLAAEVAHFGIKVTLVEPIGYDTDWGPSALQADQIAAYQPIREAHAHGPIRTQRGDPAATGPAILELADAAEPPLRLFFGAWPLGMMRDEYTSRLKVWEQWSDLARRAQGAA